MTNQHTPQRAVSGPELRQWHDRLMADVRDVFKQYCDELLTMDVAAGVLDHLEKGEYAHAHNLMEAFFQATSNNDVTRHMASASRTDINALMQGEYKATKVRYVDPGRWQATTWRMHDGIYRLDLNRLRGSQNKPTLVARVVNDLLLLSDLWTKEWDHGVYLLTGSQHGNNVVEQLDVDFEGKLTEPNSSWRTRRERKIPRRTWDVPLDWVYQHMPNVLLLRDPDGDVFYDPACITRNCEAMQKDALFVSHKLTRARNSEYQRCWMQRMKAIQRNWELYLDRIQGLKILTPLLPEKRAAVTAVKSVRVLLDK